MRAMNGTRLFDIRKGFVIVVAFIKLKLEIKLKMESSTHERLCTQRWGYVIAQTQCRILVILSMLAGNLCQESYFGQKCDRHLLHAN